MQEPRVKFKDFQDSFEDQEFPFVIHSDLHHELNERGDFFSKPVIEKYLIEEAQLPYDEYSEFMPVFKVDQTDDYFAVVVWSEGLLTYEYWLITYDRKGQVIDKTAIAGQKVGETGILTRVATIETPTSILIVEAETDLEMRTITHENPEEINLEINPSGFIINL